MKSSFLAFMFLLAPLAAVAHAQTPPSAEEQAADLFERARNAFRENDVVHALELFREANGLAPADAVRFNIALCEEHLGHYRRAIEAYGSVETSQELSEADRTSARDAISRLRRRLAIISVDGHPAGASVSIDDEARCELPCRAEVDPGRHVVAITAGELRSVRTVEATAGQTVPVLLEAVPLPTQVRPEPEPDPIVQPPPEVVRVEVSRFPTWITWTGGAVALLGAGGTVAFGLQTASVHDQFLQTPSDDLANEGENWRLLTNTMIVTAGIGAALILLDALVNWRPSP